MNKRDYVLDNILTPNEKKLIQERELGITYQELGEMYWKDRSTMVRQIQKIERIIAKETKKLQDFENMMINWKCWDEDKIDNFFRKELKK